MNTICKLALSMVLAFVGLSGYARLVSVADGPYKYKVTSDSTVMLVGDVSYRDMESVVIPSAVDIDGRTYVVAEIGRNAFKKCKKVKSVEVPVSVTKIGDAAFVGCENLEKVVISQGVMEIGDHAFTDCRSLRKVEIPSSVKMIGNYAFSGCKDFEVVIDNSKKNVRVGVNAFIGYREVRYER